MILPRHPDPIARDYERRLLARNRQCQRLLLAGLSEVMRESADFEKHEAATRGDSVSPTFLPRLIQVVDIVAQNWQTKRPAETEEAYLRRIGAQTDAFTTGQQMKMFSRRVKMTNPFPSLKASGLMDGWLAANVDLITSIDTRFFADVRDTVEEAVRSGVTTDRLAEDIEARFGVSDSRARLIARDQVAKLNADITQNRQASLGVKEYIWSTSGDGRVRESHQEMDGQVCSYDSPPLVDGENVNPGQAVSCRCVALAILPGESAEELRKSYGAAG